MHRIVRYILGSLLLAAATMTLASCDGITKPKDLKQLVSFQNFSNDHVKMLLTSRDKQEGTDTLSVSAIYNNQPGVNSAYLRSRDYRLQIWYDNPDNTLLYDKFIHIDAEANAPLGGITYDATIARYQGGGVRVQS